MLCVSIKPSDNMQLEQQFKEASNVAQMVELRVDGLEVIDFNQIRSLIHSSQSTTLLTLRSKAQGGDWEGSEEERKAVLTSLAACSPDLIDLEYDLPLSWIEEMKTGAPNVKTLLSYHHLRSTPDNLEEILEGMREKSADYYKIATTARTIIDTLRVLLLSKREGVDLIALTMGGEGEISRIIAPVVGSPWSYAALSEEEKTAPGQMTVREMEEIYSYSTLSPNTTLYGLIGDPIHFSIGEIYHNNLYRSLQIDALYVKIKVKSEELEESLPYLKELGFRGISVTIPHKESVMKNVSLIDESAEKIGAVNTLTFTGEEIFGANTDAEAALDAIEELCDVLGRSIVIVGAGGSSRSIAYEAKRRGAAVTVVARRVEQARALGEALEISWGAIDSLPDHSILVNATPSELPIEEEQIISGSVVMELKCQPRETALLSAAKRRGCTLIYGMEMFNRQAQKQVEIWMESGALPIL